ncbi:hypothetical protein GGS20DRAFT_403938 [Poronia punctata]|nr:hypothetical protein GGS20DRAFT_403938 [Poronia punctata]
MPCELVTETYGVQLPARYELRRLDPDIEPWLRALSAYVLLLDLPIYTPLYKDRQPIKRLLEDNRKRKAAQLHCVESGLSYGIFDKEYRYKRPESAATGGAVYWHEIDPDDPDLEETGQQKLLEAIDFPIVCAALSYDKAIPIPPEVMEGVVGFIPEYNYPRTFLAASLSSVGYKPETPKRGEVLVRGGTMTRRDYVGRGLMTAISRFIMHDAHVRGFKKIDMPMANASVSKIWLNPPAPYRAELVVDIDIRENEVEIDGKMVRLFSEAKSGLFQFAILHLR